MPKSTKVWLTLQVDKEVSESLEVLIAKERMATGYSNLTRSGYVRRLIQQHIEQQTQAK